MTAIAGVGACPVAATPLFCEAVQRDILERVIFEAGKLDPHYGDRSALAPCALRINPATWRELAALAEAAWRELIAAEAALFSHPRTWRALGLSARLRRLLGSSGAPSDSTVRFCRIDFHPTPAGWRVSEINADVPGGFIEAGPLTRIVASHVPFAVPPPDPAEALAGALAAAIRRIGIRGDVALVHATSYTDDQQVLRCIARELHALGICAVFSAPGHLAADAAGSGCFLRTTRQRIGAVLRFFPGEWLENLPRGAGDLRALAGGGLLCANPLSALLLQSKRLPLVLQTMGMETPTWTALLPPVRSLGWRAPVRRLPPAASVLKPVWGRVGEGVCFDRWTPGTWRRGAILNARLFPSQWILQEQFESQPIACSPPVHVCLGVYVIAGKAAGVYGRVANVPLVDARARDAAVLIDLSPEPSEAGNASAPVECSHAT
jgi:hypothetical protein